MDIDDASAHADLDADVERLERELTLWEFQCMMSDPDDVRNAIVDIHPGAGGTESADWAAMLLRMYLRYMERRGFQAEVIDLQPNEQAGIKSASIEVSGGICHGYLKAESGVHRLVRLSPFDSNNRRHTSFAWVFVYPEAEESGEIVVNPAELRVDTYRASGPGGQNVNKVETAIRITHIPTGIVVSCQTEPLPAPQPRLRDEIPDGETATTAARRGSQATRRAGGVKTNIAWGSQIRSYVLHPYQMVKDHHTRWKRPTRRELDGELDRFVRRG